MLLHGFLATPLALTGLAAQLRRSGYCAHVVQLGGLFGRFNTLPVEETASLVAERVERLVQEHRYQRIDVVGHSEGGLIGRYYVQRLDGARRVRHLITLGTPHRGTVWAYAGYLLGRVLPSLSQMAPGSPLLRALPDHTFPRSVRLTSIYSPRDSICPPSSCRLDSHGTHLKNVEVGRLGHLKFLMSARVCSVIARELESTAAESWQTSARWDHVAPSAGNSGAPPSAAFGHALGLVRSVARQSTQAILSEEGSRQ